MRSRTTSLNTLLANTKILPALIKIHYLVIVDLIVLDLLVLDQISNITCIEYVVKLFLGNIKSLKINEIIIFDNAML